MALIYFLAQLDISLLLSVHGSYLVSKLLAKQSGVRLVVLGQILNMNLPP
jgi:hypothetical protein